MVTMFVLLRADWLWRAGLWWVGLWWRAGLPRVGPRSGPKPAT